MLDNAIKTQLKHHFEKIVHPVQLIASIDDSEKAQEMQVLLQEIGGISDRIGIAFDGNDERRPTFSVGRAGEAARIRFAGVPMGHEFTSLILALLQTGGHSPKLLGEVLDRIRSLPGEYHFETYVSLTCQNCPDVVQALNVMASIHPNTTHVMIDGALFREEVNARQVMAVPTVYLNGKHFAQGRLGVEEILAKLDSGAAARGSATITAKAPFDLLVVGGGPAGAAAAIYAARKGIRTGVVADRFGGQVLDTMDIENLVSVPHTEGPKLATALRQHVQEYDVDIMNLQRATALVSAKPGGLAEVHLAGGAMLKAKTVVIATGARWREMQVPGEREYRGRGVAYCPHCDGPLFKGKRVAVIGGGNSGVEAAIDLAGIVAHVTLLEFDNTLRADAVLQSKLFSLPNVTVIKHAQTTEIGGDGNRVNRLVYQDRGTGETRGIALEGVFVQIGLVPNTDWVKGTLALSSRGEIEIDACGQTSVPGIFAAGDVTTVPFKQIVIAMGEGVKASLGAFAHLIRNPVQQATPEPEMRAMEELAA
ncbi:MAG TPA: alkyl hydroperoxide reductase subunit F [Burkholderiaceae bacterium]|nr:alkyl hydroperoxide reductase subunit F [Burkholderiaceae bacterium]